jgi:hypothetical protein
LWREPLKITFIRLWLLAAGNEKILLDRIDISAKIKTNVRSFLGDNYD